MSPPAPRAYTSSGKPLELILYKTDTCMFCHLVFRVIDALKIPVEYRDIRQSADTRRELIAFGGKAQVPCLAINGRPLYESRDIIRFLQQEVRVEAG